MDKADLILEKLNAMELALRADNKVLHHKVDHLDHKVNHLEQKVDLLAQKQEQLAQKQEQLAQKQEMTWQAVMEIQNELTENSLKIKTINKKKKA